MYLPVCKRNQRVAFLSSLPNEFIAIFLKSWKVFEIVENRTEHFGVYEVPEVFVMDGDWH